jgi:hypothetical protein
MKEIIDEIDSRIKSQFFGYFILSFLAVNWEEVLYLIVDNSNISTRINHFHNGTDAYSLILYPVLLASTYSIVYPWIQYLFMFFSSKPTDLKNTLHAKSEHKFLIKKHELENTRNELLSSAENELIERAKRDVELNKIEDENVKEYLKNEINELRVQRDKLKTESTNQPDNKISEDELDIMHIIIKHKGEASSKEIIEFSSFDKIKTEYYLESMENEGYLFKTYESLPIDDYLYSFTTKGKKLMMDKGYVQ